MKKRTSIETYIKKGRLGDTYSHLDLRIQKDILSQLAGLLSENNHPNPEISRTIFPCIAVYQALLQHDYSKAQARNVVRKGVMDSYTQTVKFARTVSKLPFFFPLFRAMCRQSMKEGVNEKGWTFTWRQNDKNSIVWDCHACIYANIFAKYEVRELAPIFCECEDIIYGNLNNLRWSRTKTIGRGADICNFSFYTKKKA